MTTQRPRVTRNAPKFKDLLRDTRFWRVAGQVIAVLLFLLLVILVIDNVIYNLRALGIQLGFGFLGSQASFDIGETLISYNPADSYGRAILVGLVNSLRVIAVGLVLATILGLVAGIARLSNNWLVRQLALVYVETIRNIPLLLQLFFWYFAFFLQLPNVTNRITLPGPTYLSSRGLYLPWIQGSAGAGIWLLLLALGIAGAIALWRWRTRVMQERGVPGNQLLWALGPIVAAIALAYIINGAIPFSITLPQLVGTEQIEGGLRLSPEFGTLLLGLVVYTGSFIAEIVRAGIQAVPQGQWEAARALGLKPGRVMQSVVLPQALRVIIPPLTSQYLNLAKNSSLAIAIGFPDVYFVASTTFNQTGRAVEVMFLIMITYLTISLIISLVMNLFNRTVQFKER
ncbi:ABC transporter permease subunit [Gloeocapsa sp. BRSZ]